VNKESKLFTLPVKYEPVVSSDLPEILTINNLADPAVNALTKTDIHDLFKKSKYFTKAVSGNKICAFLLVLPSGIDYKSLNYRWFSKNYTSFLYVDRIAVSPEFQGKGIGQHMYRSLFDFSRETGVSRIACEVNIRPANHGSLKFHKRLEFLPLGTQDTDGGKKTVRFFIKDI